LKHRDLKIKLLRLREKLWWFDVVYPVTLILFLFGSLTYIIYAGEPQSRISRIAEKQLLIHSMRLSGPRPIQTPGKVLVVNVSPFEINTFGRAPGGMVPDVNAGAYAKIIRHLANSEVRNIFVNWDTEAHLFDEIYMLPLTETLKQKSEETNIFFGMHPDHIGSMPAEFSKIAVMLDSGPCDEITEIQIECVYNKKWDDWVVQSVINVLGENNRKDEIAPPWISMELSSNSPRYILNISTRKDIESISFSDLLNRDISTLNGYEAAFVGVDYRNVLSPSSLHSFPLMVSTIHDPVTIDPRFSGTPMHVFWAQIAQMYIDRGMISVPSNKIIWATTIAYSILVLLVMFYFGGIHALGMFIVFGLAGPTVNAWALRNLQIYVPLFDAYYFGVTILITAGMLRLSFTSYQRWRLETQSHYHSKITDLKSNFISLFSHNLNTPVAKMQGMLGILKTSMNDQPEAYRRLAFTADTQVGLLEYAIRGVLVGSAIEEQSINDTSRPLRNLYVDLLESNASSLRRLGVNIAPKLLHEADDELLFQPILFDVRAVSATISSVAALFRSMDHGVHVQISMKKFETEKGDQGLTFEFICADSRISLQAAEILSDPEKRMPLKKLQGDKFIDEILAGLATLLVSHYRGAIAVSEDDLSQRIVLTILSPSA
jgi:hypothetical protein